MLDNDDSASIHDMDTTCAVCGRHLNQNNRSATQSDLCKYCSGEEDDLNDDMDLK